MPQGGAKRRAGSEFMLDKHFSNSLVSQDFLNTARIIPFNYTDDESYLVFFHTDETDGNYYVSVINTQSGVIGRVFMNGGSSAGYSYDSIGGGTSVSTNSMEDGDQISKIHYAQNGRVMFFAHPDMPPFILFRLAKNSFQMFDFYRPPNVAGLSFSIWAEREWTSWPFMDLNTSTVTITSSASALGATTLTASSALFTANMVGSPVMITNSGTTGVVFITGFTSATVVTGTIVRVLPGTSAYTGWALAAWSKERGYPRTVTFYDGRAVWGGTKSEPEKIWFSQLGDIYELSNVDTLNPGATRTADDPGSVQPLSTEINEITWLAGGNRNLLIGTRGREYSIETLSGDGLSTSYKSQTSSGSEWIQPCIVEDTPVFVQRGYRKLREMIFDYRVEGYSAPELTFFAEHMPRISQGVLGDLDVARIKYMQYTALDNSVLWIVDTNGYLFACTKNRENAVTAFHRHELGGEYDGEFPKVLSIAAVKSENRTSDELWMLVERTINATSKVYLERITKDFYGTSLHSDLETRENQPVFVDCAKILRPKTANFWAKLTTNSTATKAGGSGTGTTTGTVTYTNGVAFTAAATSYISWDGTSNCDFAQTGCIRVTVMADSDAVLAAGPTGLTIFCISQAAGNTNNLIELEMLNTFGVNNGDLRLTIRDSAGSAIINGVTIGTISLYSTPVVLELNYDLTNGETRLFVNGEQLGSTITSTGTRSSSIDLLRINADESGNNSLDSIAYTDLLVFDSVQHTADHEVFEHVESGTTITELDYLEGEEVSVLADGLYVGEETVASGSITLADTYTTIIVGKQYRNTLEIMGVDAGTGIGSAQGSIKRIDRAVVRFENTAAASIGTTETAVEEQVFRLASTPASDPIVLVTDDKVIEFPGDYDRQATVVVTSTDPLPCSVTCIVARGVTGDV
jgi:hypothetical protein